MTNKITKAFIADVATEIMEKGLKGGFMACVAKWYSNAKGSGPEPGF